jgi:predicted phosphodiesterase
VEFCKTKDQSRLKTVLISDIHGVDEALRQILSHHDKEPVVCLGDAVGNRPNDETLRLLKERDTACLKGNHEVDLIHLYKVSDTWRNWIRAWPFSLLSGDVLYAHTWLDQNSRFYDIDSIFAAQEMYRSSDFRVAFVGHSHSPGWWWRPSHEERPVWTHARPETTLELAEGRYIVDVGSVGEPVRDGDPRYVVWDGERVVWRALPLV